MLLRKRCVPVIQYNKHRLGRYTNWHLRHSLSRSRAKCAVSYSLQTSANGRPALIQHLICIIKPKLLIKKNLGFWVIQQICFVKCKKNATPEFTTHSRGAWAQPSLTWTCVKKSIHQSVIRCRVNTTKYLSANQWSKEVLATPSMRRHIYMEQVINVLTFFFLYEQEINIKWKLRRLTFFVLLIRKVYTKLNILSFNILMFQTCLTFFPQ